MWKYLRPTGITSCYIVTFIALYWHYQTWLHYFRTHFRLLRLPPKCTDGAKIIRPCFLQILAADILIQQLYQGRQHWLNSIRHSRVKDKDSRMYLRLPWKCVRFPLILVNLLPKPTQNGEIVGIDYLKLMNWNPCMSAERNTPLHTLRPYLPHHPPLVPSVEESMVAIWP